MTIKVGINGFGRIGRVVFRTCMEYPDLEVSAINDPAIDVEYIHYLISFDSTHGKFKGSVSHKSNQVTVNGKPVQVFHQKLPTAIPWHTAEVKYVVEASGMFTMLDKAAGHLSSAGVCRVIVTAPSVDVPMLILGVNEDTITPDVKLVSCASSTLYCLAPFVKLLEDNFGVSEGFVTSIHAMTPSLKPLDGLCVKGKHWRDHRSIHQNIIPANTGACRTLGRILPAVKNKLTGLAFRVPIVNVSVLDLSIKLSAHTNMQTITKIVEEASQKSMKNIIKTSHGNAVSSDFIGDSYSCILDSTSCLQLKPNFFKFICWYENEYSYACRIVDTIFFTEKSLKTPSIPKIIKPISLNNKDMCLQTDSLLTKTSSTERRTAIHAIKSSEFRRQLPMRLPNLKSNSHSHTHVKIFPRSIGVNDMFNIYTDDAKDLPGNKENKIPIITYKTEAVPKTDEPASMSTHDRLEKVKMEFSKMAKITEALLKKSNKNTMQLSPETKAALEQFVDAKVTSDFLKENLRSALKVNKQTSLQLSQSNGCRVKKAPKTDSGIDIKTALSNTERRIRWVLGSYLPTNSSYMNEINDDSKNYTRKNIQDNTAVSVNKSQKMVEPVSDAVKKTGEGKGMTIEKCATLLETKRNIVAAKKDRSADLKNEKTLQPSIKNESISNDNTEDSALNVIIEPVFAVCPQNKNVNIIITEENNDTCTLRSYKPDVMKPTTDDEKAKAINKQYVVFKPENKHERRHDDHVENKKYIGEKDSIAEVQEKDLENLEQFMRYDETASPSVVRSEYNFSTPRYQSTPPQSIIDTTSPFTESLYDKLDSASATDSDNSFQVNEKLSQVLNISDLTKSLHDLEELDKICRIIEISDDMSDRLFSSLNSGTHAAATKKWSFKDLCEKIKLNDFCDTVFGGKEN